ncbi:RNA polymerase sigma factor SigI [Alicyclobacillus contaminans]|uniref:RNA polymerase sigma factor SigI n=1 Tax=Alicyclobacillus contaminans TaxID=392016 RepID=UPI0004088FC0|nr:RNA polymerase sigma factor SigI [Alicyclobacillus contaminans]GMA51932.1 RNA polymerase sigma factor SigI [Alicyclobacillus contaminans]
MRGLSFRRKNTEESVQLDTLLRQAQAGDDEARNRLIEAYSPFVLRIASQAARRYIERGRDDEYSVALLAMNEAIDRYDPDRKVNFLGFAETIIRRRLIDHFRAQRTQSKAVPWTEFDVVDDEDNVTNYVEVQSSIAVHQQSEEQAERRQEIEEYAERLREFGLSLMELVELSPKHADARRNAIEVARVVADDEALRRFVFEKQALPLKALEAKVGVSRKTMERQRKYILAVVVLLCGDFRSLQSFITE